MHLLSQYDLCLQVYNLCTRPGCGYTARRVSGIGQFNLLATVNTAAAAGVMAVDPSSTMQVQFGSGSVGLFANLTWPIIVSSCPGGQYFDLETKQCFMCAKNFYRSFSEVDQPFNCTECPLFAITPAQGSSSALDCRCETNRYFDLRLASDVFGNGASHLNGIFLCLSCPLNWVCPKLVDMNYRNFSYLPTNGYWTHCTDPLFCDVYSCPIAENCVPNDKVDYEGNSVCFPKLPNGVPRQPDGSPFREIEDAFAFNVSKANLSLMDPSCMCSEHSRGRLCGVPRIGYMNEGNTVAPYPCKATLLGFCAYSGATLLVVAFMTYVAQRESFVKGTMSRGVLLYVLINHLQITVTVVLSL